MVDTLDRAKRFAKRLQKEARTSEPLRLSAAQEIAAKVLGYKDWHHLTVRLQEGRPLAEPAVGGRHLESALRDLGSAVDGRELYGRLAGVAGPDSGVDPDFVPTPSSRAVVELVERCPVGRFVLVTGQPDSGKSAAVGQLVGARREMGPSPAGNVVAAMLVRVVPVDRGGALAAGPCRRTFGWRPAKRRTVLARNPMRRPAH